MGVVALRLLATIETRLLPPNFCVTSTLPFADAVWQTRQEEPLVSLELVGAPAITVGDVAPGRIASVAAPNTPPGNVGSAATLGRALPA